MLHDVDKQTSFKGSICVLLVYVEKSPLILCIRSIPNCPQPRSRPEEEEEEEAEEAEEALGTFAFTTYSLTNSHLHGEAPRRGQPIGCLPGNTGGQISRLPHALPSSLSCLVSRSLRGLTLHPTTLYLHHRTQV